MTILLEVLACSLYLTDIYLQSIYLHRIVGLRDGFSFRNCDGSGTNIFRLAVLFFTILRRSFLQSAMGARKSSNTFSIGILFFGYMLYLLYIYIVLFIYIYTKMYMSFTFFVPQRSSWLMTDWYLGLPCVFIMKPWVLAQNLYSQSSLYTIPASP